MDPKYFLGFLADSDSSPDQRIVSEHRLVCSGQMYSGENPFQSIFARVLLETPISLVVAIPMLADMRKSYPQEWALRMSVRMVGDQRPKMFRQHYPDVEIVSDMAAMLTLLCRRLITVAGRVSVTELSVSPEIPDWIRQMPVPLATSLTLKYWPEQPSIFVNVPGCPDLQHFEPLVKRFETERITAILKGLPKIPHAERVVLAARMYWAAMAAVYDRIDIAYLLMTMSVEALANHAVTGEDARAEAKTTVPRKVVKKLEAVGLTDAQIKGTWNALAEARSTFKFGKFMADNVKDDLWTSDDLFRIDDFAKHILPKKGDFAQAIKDVYERRNLFVHHGQPYPAMIEAGIGPVIPSEASIEILAGERFPPFVWFERAVHLALVNYIEKAIAKVIPAP